MARTNGRLLGAIASQILAQAVAGWGLIMHMTDWQNASVWVVAPLVAAIAVPFRHNGSLRDRATGNFGAAIVVAGQLIWELVLGNLDGTGGGLGFGLVATLMLVATVLFCTAGAFFWILREDR